MLERDRSISILKIVIILLTLALFLNSSLVFAERSEVDSVVDVGKGHNELSSVCSAANATVDSSITGGAILEYSDGLLSFSNARYSKLTVDEKREFMETALLKVKNSDMASQVKNKSYNFIAEQDSTTSQAVKYLKSDASADFVKAQAWFRPFGSFFGVIMGVICLFIFGFIGLSIVFDIAYMVLPGFRVIMERGKDNKRPRFISREAYSAVVDSEMSIGHEYQSSMGAYMRRRVPAIILMSIALGYLISGQLYDLIAWVIDSFTWMFEQ